MICSSVQPPMPVSRSGVMLDEYTVPNGPSYFRPPALTVCFGTVWQPQPPVAPKTYFPRAISVWLAPIWASAPAVWSIATSTAAWIQKSARGVGTRLGSRRDDGDEIAQRDSSDHSCPRDRQYDVNRSGAPGVPTRLRRRQPGLHDEGVLTGVVVVAPPAPHDSEAEGVVEGEGMLIAWPY